jgi:hypothetical protein
MFLILGLLSVYPNDDQMSDLEEGAGRQLTEPCRQVAITSIRTFLTSSHISQRGSSQLHLTTLLCFRLLVSIIRPTEFSRGQSHVHPSGHDKGLFMLPVVVSPHSSRERRDSAIRLRTCFLPGSYLCADDDIRTKRSEWHPI